MKRDDGFTLLELLVAMAITVIVLGLTLQAFRGALDSNAVVQSMAETNENLQMAVTQIGNDLMAAGENLPRGGLALPYDSLEKKTTVTWPGPGAPLMAATPPVLYWLTPADSAGAKVSDTGVGAVNSDAISILYADPTLPPLPLEKDGTTVDDDGSIVTVHYDPDPDPSKGETAGVRINNGTTNRILVGDLFAIQGGAGTVVQEVTDAATADNPQQITFRKGGDALKFNQPTMDQGTIKWLKASGSVSQAVRIVWATYFIDRGTTENPTQPMLYRRINGRPPQPIAVGIENLQIAYDMFNGGTGFVSWYAPAEKGMTPNDVRKVRVFVGARSETIPIRGRDYFRNSVTTEVTIRSLGLFDQYQGSVNPAKP